MTTALRPRNLIIGFVVVTAAIGGMVFRSSTATPAVAVRAAASASAPSATDTEKTLPGVVIDSNTSTSIESGKYPYPSIDDSHRDDIGFEGGLTPPTTSVVQVPREDVSNMHRHAPTGTLRSQSGHVEGMFVSSCWRINDTQKLCACGDGWVDPDFAIDAAPGESLALEFDRDDSPRIAHFSVSDSYDGEALSHGDLNTQNLRITAPTRPGIYWISAGTWWPEGDVSYTYKIKVSGEHAANATGSILGRTDGDPKHTTLRLTGPAGRTIEITPDDANRFRFNNLPAGTYELEGHIVNYPSSTTAADGQITSVASSARVEKQTVELKAGEILRADFLQAN